MNEDHIKKLIKKSKVETSANFTDNLMSRLDTEEELSIQQLIGISFRNLVIICIALVLLIGFLAFKLTNQNILNADYEGNISMIPLVVIGLGVILYIVNNFIRTMELSLQ